MKTATDIISAQRHRIVSVSPDTKIREALEIMTGNNFGAMLVEEDSEIIGIWTERDLMRNVLVEGFDINTALIRDYMTTNLHYAEPNETLYQLQDKFLGLRIRHLLVKRDDKFLGMVSSGDVTRLSLEEKNEELTRLNKIINWEYYENWHWGKN